MTTHCLHVLGIRIAWFFLVVNKTLNSNYPHQEFTCGSKLEQIQIAKKKCYGKQQYCLINALDLTWKQKDFKNKNNNFLSYQLALLQWLLCTLVQNLSQSKRKQGTHCQLMNSKQFTLLCYHAQRFGHSLAKAQLEKRCIQSTGRGTGCRFSFWASTFSLPVAHHSRDWANHNC